MSTTGAFDSDSKAVHTPKDSKSDSNLTDCLVIITNKLFHISYPLNSINLSLTANSCAVWIPSNTSQIIYHSKGKSNSTLCFAFNFSLIGLVDQKINYDNIVKSNLIKPNYSFDISNHTFWTTSIRVNNAQIYESFKLPQEVFTPLDPEFTVYAEALNPFGYFKHTVDINELTSNVFEINEDERRSLNFTVEVSDMEVNLRMDYRPLLSIYSNTIEPLIKFFESNQLTKPQNLLVQPMTHSDVKDNPSSRDQTPLASQHNNLRRKRLGHSKISKETAKENQFISIPFKENLNLQNNVGLLFKNISTTSFHLKLGSISLSVVNDIFKHPNVLFRISLNSLIMELKVEFPLRRSIVLQLKEEFGGLNGEASSVHGEGEITASMRFGLSSLLSKGSNLLLPLSHPKTQQNAESIIRQSPIRHDNATPPQTNIEPFLIKINFDLPNILQLNEQKPVIAWISNSISDTHPQYQELETYYDQYITDLYSATLAINGINYDNNDPSNFLAKYESNNATTSKTVKVYPMPIFLRVDLPHVVNLNITMPFVESMLRAAKAVEMINPYNLNKQNANKSNEKSNGNVIDMSIAVIRNETGLLMKYWSKDPLSAEFVQVNQEIPMVLENERISSRQNLSSPSKRRSSYKPEVLGNKSRLVNLSFLLPNNSSDSNYNELWIPILDLPLDGHGCRFYSLDSTNRHNNDQTTPNSSKSNDLTAKSIRASDVSVANKTIVGVDLVTAAGIKTLVIRSTLKICNNTTIPILVRVINNTEQRLELETVLWEAILSPAGSTQIPAVLASLPRGLIVFSPVSAYSYHRSNLICFPFPEWIGSTVNASDLVKSSFGSNRYAISNNSMGNGKKSDGNFIRIREGYKTSRNSPDVLSYSHWVNCDYEKKKDDITVLNFNVDITTKGSNNGNLSKKSSELNSSLLRTINIVPPIVINNLLANEIEVSISHIDDNNNDYDNRNIMVLKPGETRNSYDIHASESFSLHMILKNLHVNYAVVSSLVIEGSMRDPSETTILTIPVTFKNSSILSIQLEVLDVNGARHLNFFLPFWIITSSFLPLQFQHDLSNLPTLVTSQNNTSTFNSNNYITTLNGVDGLAADQSFDDYKSNKKTKSNNQTKKFELRGIRKVRGKEVVLGPDIPLRGLTDILSSSIRSKDQISCFHQKSYFPSSLLSNEDRFSINIADNFISSHKINTRRLIENDNNNDVSNQKLAAIERYGSDPLIEEISPNIEYRLTQYSYTNPVKHNSHLKVRIKGSNSWREKILSLDKLGITYFEVNYPTIPKLTEGMDFNSIYQSNTENLRLCSYGVQITTAEPPFDRTKIVPNKQVPIWWYKGSRNLQVRLERYGGEKFSPYRFENHTLDTFKIRQLNQPLSTNLLPYHCSAYAWDEPEAQHLFSIEILKNRSISKNEWLPIGTFTFDHLENISRKAKDNLFLRVIASGPTRVLQIFDKRVSTIDRNMLSLPITKPIIEDNNNKILSYGSNDNESILSSNYIITSTHNVDKILLNVIFNASMIGLSIIDQKPQE
eukprot:gene13300-17819_t